jgi:hypothetical protein
MKGEPRANAQGGLIRGYRDRHGRENHRCEQQLQLITRTGWSGINGPGMMKEGCPVVARSFRSSVYRSAAANAPVLYQVADAPK